MLTAGDLPVVPVGPVTMPPPDQCQVTELLAAIRGGDLDARERLFLLLGEELRAIAADKLRGERAGHTLQPTALVNEAVVRLLDQQTLSHAPDRHYLFAAISTAMCQVLVDHARARAAAKRGGRWTPHPLDAVLDLIEQRAGDVVSLNDALDQLAAVHERASQVVSLRFLAGYSETEVAGQLGVSLSTVQSDWRFARAWLRLRLRGDPE